MDSNAIKDRFEVLMLGFQNDGDSQLDKFIYLLNDKDLYLARGIITWKTINSSVDFSVTPKDIKDTWEWCWQFCKFDLISFSKIMGINATEAKELIMRMKSMKLIYPDGSINNIAYGIIKSIIKKGIEKSTGQDLSGGKKE